MANRMKKMKYEPTFNYRLLYEGDKDGYHIAIVSYGTHPCAYVSVPKSHPYYGIGYDNAPIDCHYGLTFSEPNSKLNEYKTQWNESHRDEDIWWIGWDYAHCTDYYGNCFFPSLGPTKAWTTKEIREECYDVIKQLKEAAKGA
jgi:hypothetical protein